MLFRSVLDESPTVTWEFPQYLGWAPDTIPPSLTVLHYPVRLPNGAYECVAERKLDEEQVEVAREARVQAILAHKGKTAVATMSIVLLPNHPPENVAVTVLTRDGNTIATPGSLANVSKSTVGAVLFRASGSDPDLDLLSFRWSIQVGGSVLRLYGRAVVVPLEHLAVDTTIGGANDPLVATDRFGKRQSGSINFPTLTVKA